MIDHRATQILDYWFDATARKGTLKFRNDLWFGVSESNDADINEHFEQDVTRAAGGDYDPWLQTAEGRLALLILMDQFPRNIYRGLKNAFQYDDVALNYCLEGIALGHDKQLQPIERIFFYLPMEHNESRDVQQLCVRTFDELLREAPNELKSEFEASKHFAILHRDIIEKFGRFPHRNAVLGRISTTEEQEYLNQTDQHFGQK